MNTHRALGAGRRGVAEPAEVPAFAGVGAAWPWAAQSFTHALYISLVIWYRKCIRVHGDDFMPVARAAAEDGREVDGAALSAGHFSPSTGRKLATAGGINRSRDRAPPVDLVYMLACINHGSNSVCCEHVFKFRIRNAVYIYSNTDLLCITTVPAAS
jgi:hypothetical protein